MPKDSRSVRMPLGTEDILEGLATEEKYPSVNQLMVAMILEGIERRRNPPPPAPAVGYELERLRAENAELRAANTDLDARLRKVGDEVVKMLEHEKKLGADLAEANKRADDATLRAMELEHERDKAKGDKEAAEHLLEELDVPKLSKAVETATQDLEKAKRSIEELTGKFGAAERELAALRARPPVQAGVPQADYDKVLRTAHTLRNHLERAVILPKTVLTALTAYTERSGSSSWRWRACELLVETLRHRGNHISTEWGTDVESTLPRLPDLPPISKPAK